jgi:hypothetical protein
VQWSRVVDVAPEPSHDLLLVPGGVGQAHDHFSRRIRELLTPMPPRAIVSVNWRKRPASRDEFFAALADDLRVAPDRLSRELSERLSDSNLVLLHPCIRTRYVDPAIVRYYSEWWPALLDDIKPRKSLKCVQPVEWPLEEGGVGKWLTWARLKSAPADDTRQDAETLIEQIRGGSSRLRAIKLQELSDISEGDLDEFCQIEKLSFGQKGWFLSKIKSRHPKNSEEILESIDALLPDARSVT